MEKTSSALWKRDHISQFITFLNDLKNVEVKIDDKDQAKLLLCSLPSS
ncbi:hypothetical protein Gotur_004986 [Gossypium turneri]